jgi:hypothetical protein
MARRPEATGCRSDSDIALLDSLDGNIAFAVAHKCRIGSTQIDTGIEFCVKGMSVRCNDKGYFAA